MLLIKTLKYKSLKLTWKGGKWRTLIAVIWWINRDKTVCNTQLSASLWFLSLSSHRISSLSSMFLKNGRLTQREQFWNEFPTAERNILLSLFLKKNFKCIFMIWLVNTECASLTVLYYILGRRSQVHFMLDCLLL